MTDVRTWLHSNCVGQYGDSFEANEVDWDVVPDLDHQILRDIGVSAAGDRMRILKAVKALGEDGRGSESVAGRATEPRPGGDAERRQLTVMFADLVGSTELSRRLDPEDLRRINRSFQGAAQTAIERCGGYVARYMGDGVLAYFSYPQAREDDAERALRAGLLLTETVPTLSQDVALAVRIGIATGPVVVGDVIGDGAAQERAVVGETPNLAARLQGQAEQNTVVISESTKALTAGLFRLDALPARKLKGFDESIVAFRVKAEARGRSRFAARAGSHLSPFVGRNEEGELLARRWSLARDGRGQVAVLVGEPGIGKSRLLQHLQAEVVTDRHETIFLQCSPNHEASALYPTIAAFERVLRFSKVVGDAQRLEALQQHLAQTQAVDAQTLGLLAALLSIPSESQLPGVNVMDAALRRERTLSALVEYVCRLAGRSALVCVFEDVHWADPTTRELLGRLVKAVESTPILLLVTSRPGFEAGWADLAHVQVMHLSRLAADAATQLLGSAPGVNNLDEDTVEIVLNRAEGNPLYIEELTRTVTLSAKPIGGNGAIPATLQDSLMARIDSTGIGKPVAQYAAVIGRSFDPTLLTETWERDSALLINGLNALEQAGLLTREGGGGLARYAFKHALICDAAYDSLLHEDRRRLHARVAEALASINPDIRASQPELLAQHYTVAEEYEKAIDYWLSAGRRATSRSADTEALTNMHKGLELLRHLPESPSRDSRELSLRVAMIAPTMATMGQGSQGMEDAVVSALAISDRTGDTTEVFPVLFSQCIYLVHRAGHEEAASVARDIARRASSQGDVVPKLVAHRVLGLTHLCLGELNDARRELERVVELYDDDRHAALTVAYGIDMKSLSLGYLSWIAWHQGAAERALSLARSAREHAQNIGHVISLGNAAWLEGILAAGMRDPEHVRQCSERLLAFNEQHGVPQWLLVGRGFADLADLMEGAHDGAATRLACHVKMRREAGFVCFITISYAELAAGQAKMGRVDDALSTLNAAADLVESGGERLFEAELLRVRGLVEAKRGCPDLASSAFLRAIQLARAQASRSLELRAATTLARHWTEIGRVSEAAQLLQPLYDDFSEGFGTWDLIQATSVLEALP